MTGAEPQAAGAALSVEEARSLFPGLANTTYFATNGQALLPRSTRDRLAAGIDDLMARGFAASAALDANVERVRGQVARLLGAEHDEIAFVRNTGEGLCLIAARIDWRPGDEVLCFGGEYRSVVHAFQGQAHRGVEVRIASPQNGRVTPELVASQLRERTRAVALSWVRYEGGLTSYLEVLDLQRSMFSSQLKASETKQLQLTSVVRLYQALGGGWVAEQDSTRIPGRKDE